MTAATNKATLTYWVGVDLTQPHTSTVWLMVADMSDIQPPKTMSRIEKHLLFGFDWANDNLENKVLDHLQREYDLGGCHGWRVTYKSPDNGSFTIYEYDFDNPAYESPFVSESDKRAEDYEGDSDV